MRSNNPLALFLIVGMLVFLTFVAVDCSSGTGTVFSATVHHLEYKPAWVEWDDDDGPTTHDEEFHVHCQSKEDGRIVDVETKKKIYHSVTNGQAVIVRSHIGRWTKSDYFPSISLDLRGEK
jgi:hypothetical protein